MVVRSRVNSYEVMQMGTQTALQPSAYEQALISIVRTLPVERVVQILDYAHYIQSRTVEDFGFLDDDETEEEIRASEEKWDRLFAKPEAQRVMREMAHEALEDYRAGRTTDITITEDGRLAPA